jgi:CRP-like cAMP-binding protein
MQEPLVPSVAKADTRNRLLRAMSDEDFDLLAPHLESCHASKGHVLFERDEPAESVWFLESGIGSIVTTSSEGLSAETGLFGRDGFAPVSIIMGTDRSAHQGVIQVADDCQRMPSAAFKEAVSTSASLRGLLLRYTQSLSVQTSYTALSNAVHHIDERLARWLLMTHDRMDGSELPLTHEFLSIMLAVRRPSVTTALHSLEGNGFIRSERGCIIIRNRAALEDFAGDAYGVPEAEYERLIGPLR